MPWTTALDGGWNGRLHQTMTGDGTKRAYIGIGSNLGDRLLNCTEATEKIKRIEGGMFAGSSNWYRTQPVGVTGQEWYLNGVVALDVRISAQVLLAGLLGIERELGRERKARWEARTIDLDMLLFGSDVLNEEGLLVPHPRMHLRRFVLVPLVQLAPRLVHPVLGVTMKELLDGLSGEDQVVLPWKGE